MEFAHRISLRDVPATRTRGKNGISRLVADGASDAEIVDRLGVTLSSIHTARSALKMSQGGM